MKKILLLILLMVFALMSSAFAITVLNKVSANTVTYNSVNFSVNRGPKIVTFNSVTSHIRLVNLSTTHDCYADIECIDANGKRGYAVYDTMNVLIPAVGSTSPNTVELDFATRNLAFSAVSDSTIQMFGAGSNLKLHYVVTGEHGEF